MPMVKAASSVKMPGNFAVALVGSALTVWRTPPLHRYHQRD
jgi:hypothetical protein